MYLALAIIILCICVSIRVLCNVVRVYPPNHIVALNSFTNERRNLERGWNLIGFQEKVMEINWLYKEEGNVSPSIISGYIIPGHEITINTEKLRITTKDLVEIDVNCAFTCQVFNPVDAVRIAQPLQRMCLYASSITTEVFCKHTREEAISNKVEIQGEITKALSKRMESLGFICKEFIIENMQTPFISYVLHSDPNAQTSSLSSR